MKLSISLINYAKSNHINRLNWYSILLEDIINSIFVLIKFKQTKSALKLIKKFNTLPISNKYTFEIIRIHFMTQLLRYTNTKDDSEINLSLQSLKNLGLNSLYSDLKFAFQQISKLYQFIIFLFLNI